MKTINIPENVNDLTSYLEFVQTIIEVNKFNSKIDLFFNKILKQEFLKSVKEWKKIVSEKDFEKIKNLFDENTPEKIFDETYLFYDYSKNKFIHVKSKLKYPDNPKFNTYYDISNIKKINPTKNGTGMLIYFNINFKESNFPGWLPTYHLSTIYEIDLLKKSVNFIKSDLTETSNKHYK